MATMLAIRDERRLFSIFSHDDGIIHGGLVEENFRETTREISKLTGFYHGFVSEHKLEDMKSI
jgi:hypothetical protein